MNIKIDEQAKLRQQVKEIILAFIKRSRNAAELGLDERVFMEFFKEVTKLKSPQGLRPVQREWWLKLVGIPHENWGSYLGEARSKRKITAEHVRRLRKALEIVNVRSEADEFSTEIPARILELPLTAFSGIHRSATNRNTEHLIRNNVIDDLENAVTRGHSVCLWGMSGLGKSVTARQLCARIKNIRAGFSTFEVSFISDPSTKEPMRVAEVISFIVKRAERMRQTGVAPLEAHIRRVPVKEISVRKNWNSWYMEALKARGEQLAAHFCDMPFAGDETDEWYLRAISEWLSQRLLQHRGGLEAIVVLDNVWNWSWLWGCIAPLFQGGISVVKFVCTAQRKPPHNLDIESMKLGRLSMKEVKALVVAQTTRAVLSTHQDKTSSHGLVEAEIQAAIESCQKDIDAVAGRIETLPIALAEYSAEWGRSEIWRTGFRLGFWRRRLESLDVPAHEEDPLYHAMSLPWEALTAYAKQRYLDLVIFANAPIIVGAVGVLWERCPRSGLTLAADRAINQLVGFADASLLQSSEQGFRLHDCHLMVARGLLLNPNKSLHGCESDRVRDFLGAIGSIDSNGEFLPPVFPIEGLGSDSTVRRADDNEPIFPGEDRETAELFLFEKIVHFADYCFGAKAVAALRKNVGYLACCGQRAAARFRQQDAVTEFGQARRALDALSESRHRTRAGIILRSREANVLLELTGYLSPEIPDLLTPAIEQSLGLGWNGMVVKGSFDLSMHYAVVGKIGQSLEVARRALDVTSNSPVIAHRIIANRAIATPLLLLGELRQVRTALEDIIAFERHLEHGSHDEKATIDDLVLDPTVTAKGSLALIYWLIGRPDYARRAADEALKVALSRLKTRNGPNTICHTICFAGAQLSEFFHDYEAVKKHCEKALDIADTFGLVNWSGHASMVKGWALCKLDEDQETGQRLLATNIDKTINGNGGLFYFPHYLMMDAEVHMDAGDLRYAEKRLSMARHEAMKIGERYWLAEINRTHGEVCLRMGNTRLAEELAKAAVDIAASQGAKSFELRATMLLARLWSNGGNRRQAKRLLAKVYSQFTEGFETRDLVEANLLLAELA